MAWLNILKTTLCASILATSLTFSPAALSVSRANLPEFSQLVEQHGKAVVNISTKKITREELPEALQNDPVFQFFRRYGNIVPRERASSSLGSGFIISEDGYILTNAHVVAGADEITVTMNDKREFRARLIGSDKKTDIAVLKVTAKSLPAVQIGKPNQLKVGEWVLAIGSPFGFESSVTAGIVSAMGRRLADDAYVPFIQTDVAINPGNSGGPLFNLDGEVVGVNSQIYSRSGGFMGISFAIPIDLALQVAEQLKAKGRVSRGKIGVSVQELNAELAKSFGLRRARGALVTQVAPSSPAEAAGVQSGDIILSVDGRAIGSANDLPLAIGQLKVGEPFRLEVWRHESSHILMLTPVDAELEQQAVPRAQKNQQKNNENARIGLAWRALSGDEAASMGVRFALLVTRSNSPMVLPGDRILGVAQQPLLSEAHWQDFLRTANSPLLLRIWRNGQVIFVLLPLR